MFGWFRKAKAPKTMELDIYRPLESLYTISTADSIKIMIALSAYPIMVYGIRRPTGSYISPAQYQQLPDYLKVHFIHSREEVEIVGWRNI